MLNQKALDAKLLTAETITLTTSSLSHLASASAWLSHVGKIGVLSISAKNTSSALAVGSDATFKITDLPTLKGASRGCGYSGSTCLVADVQASGNVTIRVTGAQWAATYDGAIMIPVVLA